MAGRYKTTVLLILTIALNVSGYCKHPKDDTDNGTCFFRIHCRGSIRGVQLPSHCQRATNYVVNVDLTLTDSIVRFDDDFNNNTDFLDSITSLKVSGSWPKTTLSFLEYMSRLKSLKLNNQITHIIGSPFSTLSRLEYIDLSHNKLQDIDDLFHFDTLPKVKYLSIAHNNISEILNDTFSELKLLTELDLSNNHIVELNGYYFCNLTNLETLRLNNNRIKCLNGAINNLNSLKHLYLKGNEIDIIVDSINVTYHLETFDLSGNQIANLRPNIFLRHWQHFEGVCKILLSGNQIKSIPNVTTELGQRFTRHIPKRVDVLTEIDLSNNSISQIEYNAFQYIVQLISLDLSHNQLSYFLVNSDHLRNVQFLNLSSNYISNLYLDSFSSMTGLRNLDLSDNKLDFIPDQTFKHNYNLKYVNLTSNHVTGLNDLHIEIFHKDGGVLDLSNNGLSRLVIMSGKALNLRELILNSNNIKDTSSVYLYYQTSLKRLEMKNNTIEELNVTSLYLPVSLEYLDLSCNSIKKIFPSTFHRVKYLRELRLRNNNLTRIEYGTFQGLSMLEKLDLSFNKITSLESRLLMDLKSLQYLSLSYNGLIHLEYKGWLGHKYILHVYLEGNNYSCEWLSSALNDFNNGFSKMRPTVNKGVSIEPSLQGIPCNPVNMFERQSMEIPADDRLLMINQKILEAIQNQTHILKIFLWRSTYQIQSINDFDKPFNNK